MKRALRVCGAWVACLVMFSAVWVRGQDQIPLMAVPGYWEAKHGGTTDDYDGYAWYRCLVDVPADWDGLPIALNLGKIDDCDETYLNGTMVGRSGSIEPFKTASGNGRVYNLPPAVVRYGSHNLIAVRVFDGGGAGGFVGGMPSLISSKGRISLIGRWMFVQRDLKSFAEWPRDPDEPDVRAFVNQFQEMAGIGFGRELNMAPLPGTRALEMQGDIASTLVEGVDRFLLKQLTESMRKRNRYWKTDKSSAEAYEKSIEPNRESLARIIGMRDERVKFESPELPATLDQTALVGETESYTVHAIRWPAFGDVHGEGLLLSPKEGEPVASVVAIPDADQTPEQLVGLSPGIPEESQFARRLADQGCRVVVPVLVNREKRPRNGRAKLTNREYIYRSAFELGRHLIGYEVNKVLGVVDWFERNQPGRVGVIGYGEGGMLALYCAAVDPRIDSTCVSGHFGSRQNIWEEPIDRNVFGLLDQFGDAELASMVAPRPLVVEIARGPELTLAGEGGAPARLVTPATRSTMNEVLRANKLTTGLTKKQTLTPMIYSRPGKENNESPYGRAPTLMKFIEPLLEEKQEEWVKGELPESRRQGFDPVPRQRRQLHELDRHNQWLLRESAYVRKEFMKKLDTNSEENFKRSSKYYRDYFRDEVIGHFELRPLPPNPRTRKAYERPTWMGYEVVLDVFPDVIAFGVLLLPKDIREGEKRPVVVCQHGLEGRPRDTIVGDHWAYHDYAARLAERGFITFAPQNLYIFEDRFRTLQRKANPIKKTLFSVMVPQHQQIVDWLQTLPYVDPERIAFYGLSYGGKTAMRVPPLVEDYCLSICSADFNEWVWKNASTRSPYSYVWTGEYEIFEFDLGSTFNYAEMAALIAPRPFMVERGHSDGVAPDETVGHEFAKVRHLYQNRLKMPDRCEIEWFIGPHTINGKGTFDFLHRHLRWPRQ